MKVDIYSLKQRFGKLDKSQLIELYLGNELTDIARSVLKEELRKRGIKSFEDVENYQNQNPSIIDKAGDKCDMVVAGAIITIPIMIYFVIWAISGMINNSASIIIKNSASIWIYLIASASIICGVTFCIIFNPYIAYNRNENVCVCGLPFPVMYGMPSEDGCIPGDFMYIHLIADILYSCLFFLSVGLFLYIVGSKFGLGSIFISFFLFYACLKIFLIDFLKIY